jgi:hypothetical protein
MSAPLPHGTGIFRPRNRSCHSLGEQLDIAALSLRWENSDGRCRCQIRSRTADWRKGAFEPAVPVQARRFSRPVEEVAIALMGSV